jgi:hypothetical protein
VQPALEQHLHLQRWLLANRFPQLSDAAECTGQAAGVIRFARQLTLVTYSRTGRREAFVGGWLRLALVWYRRGSIVPASSRFTLSVVVGVVAFPTCCRPNSIEYGTQLSISLFQHVESLGIRLSA